MPLLEWNDTFSVGFEEIDNDHKQLIGIVNRLDDAANCRRGSLSRPNWKPRCWLSWRRHR